MPPPGVKEVCSEGDAICTGWVAKIGDPLHVAGATEIHLAQATLQLINVGGARGAQPVGYILPRLSAASDSALAFTAVLVALCIFSQLQE